MNDILDSRQRKLVYISDPHIKKNDSYFIYEGILKMEQESLLQDERDHKLTLASGKYLIRDPKSHETPFTG